MSGTGQSVAMRRFEGFPAGAKATAVPSVFFSELLPVIEDDAELRVGGHPRLKAGA